MDSLLFVHGSHQPSMETGSCSGINTCTSGSRLVIDKQTNIDTIKVSSGTDEAQKLN